MKELSRDQFEMMYNAVRQQLLKDHKKYFPDQPINDQRIFGRSKHKRKGYTASAFMIKNKKINKYLSERYNDSVAGDDYSSVINSRYLYDLKKTKCDKGAKSISIKEPYNTIIPWYLNCLDFDHFFSENDLDANWVKYTGYYYSMRINEICVYQLQFRFDNSDLDGHPHHAEFKVKEKEFHDYVAKPEYSGYAYIVGGKLHLVLLSRDPESQIPLDRLKMVFDSGGNPRMINAMRGSILAVSANHGNPIISIETVIVKEDYKSDENLKSERKEEILNVSRYLNLHRNNFWIRPNLFDPEDILVKKSINVDIIDHLVGVYRVWRFNENHEIIESKLIIYQDYKSSCQNKYSSNSQLREQVCLLKINKIKKSKNETLCISTHPKKGTGTISFIILKIVIETEWNQTNSQKILEGSISFVGEDNLDPMQSPIVMKWEGEEKESIKIDEKPIEIEEVKKVECKRPMLDALISLAKKFELPQEIQDYDC